MTRTTTIHRFWPMLLIAALTACSGLPDRELAVEFQGELPAGGIVTDLGYDITLDDARLIVGELHFYGHSEEGEAEDDHGQSGIIGVHEVHRAVDLLTGDETFDAGVATLRQAYYDELHVTLVPAGDEHEIAGVDATDPLWGHSVYFAGTATRDGSTFSFTIALHIDAEIDSIPLDLLVGEDGLEEVHLMVPITTWFNGLDFRGLSGPDGVVSIESGNGAAATIEARILSSASIEHAALDDEHVH